MKKIKTQLESSADGFTVVLFPFRLKPAILLNSLICPLQTLLSDSKFELNKKKIRIPIGYSIGYITQANYYPQTDYDSNSVLRHGGLFWNSSILAVKQTRL